MKVVVAFGVGMAAGLSIALLAMKDDKARVCPDPVSYEEPADQSAAVDRERRKASDAEDEAQRHKSDVDSCKRDLDTCQSDLDTAKRKLRWDCK